MSTYKDYNPRLNSKGMPKGWKPSPDCSTARGQRRKTRSKVRHECDFKRSNPSGTSYHSARVENEARYYCMRIKTKREAGGGKMRGCGHCKRAL